MDPPKRTSTVDNRTIWPLTDAERERFLSYVHGLPDGEDPAVGFNPRRVLLFLYYSGAHPDVLVHPRKRHLEVREGRLVWFRPKTRRSISMPIPDDLAPWLEEFVAGLHEPKEHRFVTTRYRIRGGEIRERRNDVCSLRVTKAVERWMREAGLPGVSPRTFRHDRGKRILKLGGSLADVQKYLGTSPTVAARYSEDRESEIDEALAQEGRVAPSAKPAQTIREIILARMEEGDDPFR